MLVPRALFDRIGGFDEGYRLHVEDLDLCRRAREAGAAVAVANDVRVVHVRGVSSRSRPGFSEWHKHRGMWRYFSHFEAPRRGVAARAGVWLRSEGRRAGQECVRTWRSWGWPYSLKQQPKRPIYTQTF